MRRTLRSISAAIVLVTALFTCAANAANLKIPNTVVTAYIEGADDSFFDVTLSGVPSGFDVTDGTYSSYCISYYADSPVGTHPARLFDSTGTVPASLAENYGYVNYILNYKQGTADDVQAAIWYFTDGVDWDLTPAAQAMVQAALNFGLGYVPAPGDITAVILQFQDIATLQTVVIEVPTPPAQPCEDFVTGGGFIKLPSGARANFGVHGGIRRGTFWGGLNYIDHGTRMHVKSTATTGYRVINDRTRQITFNVRINRTMGTAVVTVTDNGEPGTRDLFEITLSNGYSAAGQLGGTMKRGGGGNIQLHKSKCNKRR